MIYEFRYQTPSGFSDITMLSDGEALIGLHFNGSRKLVRTDGTVTERDLPIFRVTQCWLDIYFHGRQPEFTPPCRLYGITPFRRDVLHEVSNIPYGTTATYGAIASTLAKRRRLAHMSAQAVGNAVGWNPLCIIIPCHRVLGAANRLTGYGGGIENKIALLKLEGLCTSHLVTPLHFL